MKQYSLGLIVINYPVLKVDGDSCFEEIDWENQSDYVLIDKTFNSIEGVIDFIKKDKFNTIQHIAVIMDGNGRWAEKKGYSRIKGHEKGVESVRKITEFCVSKNLKYLTLFTFSEENWNRPKKEIFALMELLVKTLDRQLDLFLNNNVKFDIIGDLSKIDMFTKKKIVQFKKKTQNNTGLHLNLAISYGSRQEIVNGINKIISKEKRAIDIEDFNSFLYTKNIPDPDLLIRTGGENRLSNFLLWQIAYTEIYFSNVYWPDFSVKDMQNAIDDYYSRERRFGRISKQL